MRSKAVELFRAARQAHAIVAKLRIELDREVKACNDMRELTDDVYAINESWKLLDDLRKQAAALKSVAEGKAVLIWGSQAGADGEPIRTAHCTGTPNMRVVAHIPKKHEDPAKYAAFMDFLGIKPELYENDDTEVVRPHWPGMVEYLTRLAEEGKPLPPGIDPSKTRSQYGLMIRSKKGVDE